MSTSRIVAIPLSPSTHVISMQSMPATLNPILIIHCLTQRYRIINPLSGIPKSELFDQVSRFCADHGLQDKETTFQKAALVAQSPEKFEHIAELDEDDKYHLRREVTRMSGAHYF
jgi:hypothetical protein